MKHADGRDRVAEVSDPSPTPSLTAASVVAGGREVRYLRGGDGARVIVLAPEAEGRVLADALCARFRVIVPRLPGADEEHARADDRRDPGRLGSFLEGLGGGPGHFVSTTDHLARVLRFASFDREHVLGVAVPGRPRGRDEEEPAAVLAGLRALGVPVLRLELPEPLDGPLPVSVLDAIVFFLEGRGQA